MPCEVPLPAAMSRLCVRVVGDPDWRLVPFEPEAGWSALEDVLLREFGADPRAVALGALGMCIREEPPILLARNAVHQLRDCDRVEVALRRRDETSPLAALMAAPSASPTTPLLRGVKREPSPARDERAAKAPSPAAAHDASPTPAPAPGTAEDKAKDSPAQPLRCFQVAGHDGNALLVGAKLVFSTAAAHLDYLSKQGVTTIVSLAPLPSRSVAAAASCHSCRSMLRAPSRR